MVEREESPKQYPVMQNSNEASLPQRSYLRNFSFCSYFLGRRFFKAMPFRMTCVWVRDSSSLRSSEWHCCHLERMWEISKTCWAAAKHLSLNTPIQEVLHSVRAFLVGDSSLRQCSVQNDMRIISTESVSLVKKIFVLFLWSKSNRFVVLSPETDEENSVEKRFTQNNLDKCI